MSTLSRVAAALALALLAAGAAASPALHRVSIEGMRFEPETLVVQPGDRVVWVNQDLVAHTATAVDGKAFDSGVIAPGASWDQVVRTPGSFRYVCTLHPTMQATLIARPK